MILEDPVGGSAARSRGDGDQIAGENLTLAWLSKQLPRTAVAAAATQIYDISIALDQAWRIPPRSQEPASLIACHTSLRRPPSHSVPIVVFALLFVFRPCGLISRGVHRPALLRAVRL